VDSNQNPLHPGKILTSMVKRVDEATYQAMDTGTKGTFKTGVNNLGLKEGGVDYAMDEHNKPLVNDEMKSAVEAAKKDIVEGKLSVHDYMADNSCPAS
jgi:basic membrane protein A and related proteins